jgi:cytochrome P450 monooxygenase-2
VVIKDATLEFVARLSSRVFLGEELCRNDAWLKITKEYTIDAFKAALKMSLVPSFLKPFARLLSADCRLVRGELNQACAILAPIIKKRKALKAQALATGKPIPVFNDVIDWAETESDGHDYDPAVLQLLLSFAAIHTTSELTVQAMLMLANNPEQIKPLREEMITVLRAEGWKKSALYNMKLLDSAIKEAQRTKPTSFRTLLACLSLRQFYANITSLDAPTCPQGPSSTRRRYHSQGRAALCGQFRHAQSRSPLPP